MKKLAIIFASVCIAFAASISSCKKDTTNVTTTPTVTPTPTTTATPTAPAPTVSNVDGAMVSLKLDFAYNAGGFPVSITTENALATFFASTGSTGTMVDAGTVSVNSIALEKQTNNSYYKTATVGMTPTSLSFGTTTSSWSVGGAGSVAAFTYNHSVTFPNYTGTMPDTVTRSSGITVTFTGKVSNADSIIVMIAAGSTSILRTYPGTAASATISAADLGALPVVSDNTGIIEVVPYRVTLKMEGTKNYAFIKQYAAVKNICIK